ncbi:MAG: stage IV sporulation protein A [Clostridiales bacterium]|jgi:stage IV sporulation protein A|nr:stage IV sporulation protein A [Clostridiales bacterium]
MQEFDIYNDIANRTNGDIYVGVVGPVRAGKSTFITRFMEILVLPHVQSKTVQDRMRDELPQRADGKTIMTTQPKFVPNDAAQIRVKDIDLRVRLVDCVGYFIEGANGHVDENSRPRMVRTPWQDKEMSFEDAAELGTQKVIQEHSTIGIVMTTDGSIGTDLPRSAYVPAEERVIGELRALGKPFVIVLNTTVPQSKETVKLANNLQEKYKAPVVAIDCQKLQEQDISNIFEKLLFEFPLNIIDIDIPKWLQALDLKNNIISNMVDNVMSLTQGMTKMSDFEKVVKDFEQNEFFDGLGLVSLNLGVGKISYKLTPHADLFFRALSDECGIDISDEFALMSSIKELAQAKQSFDKMRLALENAKQNGYGVVSPTLDDMTLEDPKIFRQGNKFGVRLRATATSLHIMQVDIHSEVSSLLGTEQQSEDLVKHLMSQYEQSPQNVWDANMFGKSLHSLVGEGLNNKINAMPEDAQRKMRRTLSRIVNEGKGGVICILL